MLSSCIIKLLVVCQWLATGRWYYPGIHQ